MPALMMIQALHLHSQRSTSITSTPHSSGEGREAREILCGGGGAGEAFDSTSLI